MHILVTGGGGYIGYHLVKQLLEENKEVQVRVLDSFLYEHGTLDEFRGNKHLKIIKGDICSITDMVKAIKDTDIVIAFAAIVGDPACALDEDQTITTNYHATHLLIELCNYYKVSRLVFASTCSVYGDNSAVSTEESLIYPLSLYAKTRAMSEELLKTYTGSKLDWVILRYATVFGWSRRMRFDLVVNFLTAKALYTKDIDILGADQWRPFIHVSDVARATILAAFADKQIVGREIFNVGSDNLNYKIKDLATYINSYIKNMKIHYKNIPAADMRNYRVSFKKIHSLLKFETKYTLKKGIREIIGNLKKLDINYLDEKYYNVKYLHRRMNRT